MTRFPQPPAPRRDGFTLIELLVVMAIIAILVSLTTAAVMRAIIQVHQTQTRVEIGQMETALQGFMTDHGIQAVPSTLVLHENMAYNLSNPQEAVSFTFLIKSFGKNVGKNGFVDWNGNGANDGPWSLDGSQVLVFLIGGIPSNVAAGATPQGTGFSNSPVDPSAQPRQPAYFTQFDSTRLVPDGQGFFRYIDAWTVKTGPKPYAFFSANGVQNAYSSGDCAAAGALPYLDTNAGNFVNPSSYQILSAGRDGVFGGAAAGSNPVWSASSGTLDTNGKDDQANFAARILAAGSQ